MWTKGHTVAGRFIVNWDALLEARRVALRLNH
jgi:hypothetical protein